MRSRKPFEEREEAWAARVQARANNAPLAARLTLLTPREAGLFHAMVNHPDATNRDLGTMVNISPRTVEIYRANIMRKLQFHHVTDITRAGIELGIIALPDPEALLERYANLTTQEARVMGLVVAGDVNKVIADKLGISPRTVEIYRSHIMEKCRSQA